MTETENLSPKRSVTLSEQDKIAIANALGYEAVQIVGKKPAITISASIEETYDHALVEICLRLPKGDERAIIWSNGFRENECWNQSQIVKMGRGLRVYRQIDADSAHMYVEKFSSAYVGPVNGTANITIPFGEETYAEDDKRSSHGDRFAKIFTDISEGDRFDLLLTQVAGAAEVVLKAAGSNMEDPYRTPTNYRGSVTAKPAAA